MASYHEKILMTYKFLLEMHEELLTRTINVGMTGELAEVNSVFKVGDSFKFNPGMFRDSKDENVQLLINFFDELENVMNSLANINDITEEEMENEDEK